MNILETIEKKRENQELTKEEIEYFVNGYTEENDRLWPFTEWSFFRHKIPTKASQILVMLYLERK